MLKQLMYKERHLALQAPAIVFEFFGVMLLIPAYPSMITFFYGLLGIFFVCMFGRENHDVEYTALLPVSRQEIVKARMGLCISLELIQLAGAVLCACLRPCLGMTSNPAGIDANCAMFGFALLLIGIFNGLFFPMYYKNPDKIGVPFLIAALLYGAGSVAVEILVHIPGMQMIDGFSHETVWVRLTVLAIGAACYVGLTLVALRVSVRRFQTVNLAE